MIFECILWSEWFVTYLSTLWQILSILFWKELNLAFQMHWQTKKDFKQLHILGRITGDFYRLKLKLLYRWSVRMTQSQSSCVIYTKRKVNMQWTSINTLDNQHFFNCFKSGSSSRNRWGGGTNINCDPPLKILHWHTISDWAWVVVIIPSCCWYFLMNCSSIIAMLLNKSEPLSRNFLWMASTRCPLWWTLSKKGSYDPLYNEKWYIIWTSYD